MYYCGLFDENGEELRLRVHGFLQREVRKMKRLVEER